MPWDLGRLLRIDEAAVLARRKAATIRKWIERGLIVAVRKGRTLFVRLGDVLAVEAARTDTLGRHGGRRPAACA